MHKDYTSINVLFQECGIVVDDIGHDYINNIKTIVIYAYPIDSLYIHFLISFSAFLISINEIKPITASNAVA